MSAIDPAIPLAIGNILLLISSAPLIHAVYKDRRALRGISPTGALLNLLAMLAFDAFYILTGNLVSLSLTIPIVLFWGIATVYSRRAKREIKAESAALARAVEIQEESMEIISDRAAEREANLLWVRADEEE